MKTFQEYLDEATRQATDAEFKLATSVLKKADKNAEMVGLAVDEKTGDFQIETDNEAEYVYDIKKKTLKKV